jgi:hypothetical protein
MPRDPSLRCLAQLNGHEAGARRAAWSRAGGLLRKEWALKMVLE